MQTFSNVGSSPLRLRATLFIRLSGARLTLVSVATSLIMLAPASAPLRAQAYQTYDNSAQPDVPQLIQRCKIKDDTDAPKDRVRCWEGLLISAPTNSAILDGMDNAKRALDEAEKTTQTQVQTSARRDSVKLLLQRAQEDLLRSNFDGADMNVAYVREKDPNNRQAHDLSDRISSARVWHSRKQLLIAVGAIVMVLVVGLVALAKRMSSLKKSEASAPASAATTPLGPRVALRVIDGIGRGRIYTIDSDMFRIGAAESDRAEERNDLIISDEDGMVSRFHCSLLRRKKKWTIVDSSINGTWVNDEPLARGEPVPLRDGDAITIAGVSRMTFVTM